jgi:hypothetical protein
VEFRTLGSLDVLENGDQVPLRGSEQRAWAQLTQTLRPHHPGFRSLERSLVCACAAPAASLPVAVQVRKNVAPLAGSPSLHELSVEPSPEGRSVALKLVASGHRSKRYRPAQKGPASDAPPASPNPTNLRRGGGTLVPFFTRARGVRARLIRTRLRGSLRFRPYGQTQGGLLCPGGHGGSGGWGGG